MKAIKMFFEMLIQYQERKYELKEKFERYKCDMRIYYAEAMKKLNNKENLIK